MADPIEIAQLQALQTAHAVTSDVLQISLPVVRAAIVVYLQNAGLIGPLVDPAVDAVLAALQREIDAALTPEIVAPVVEVPADLPLEKA